MTTCVCDRYPPTVAARNRRFGSFRSSIKRLCQNDRTRRSGRSPVVGGSPPDLGETELLVEGARGNVVLGNLQQQPLAGGTAQPPGSPRQQPTGDAAAPELREDAQRQDLGIRADGKDDHEPNGLIAGLRQRTETAGHGQNLRHGRLAPAVVEAEGVQCGRDCQLVPAKRVQQEVIEIGGQRLGATLPGAAAGADDNRTSGARR